MRHLQQYRPFIYRDRDEIDDFLEESELWRELYEIYLDVKDSTCRLDVPAVKMFNEVRYQCVRFMLDPRPREKDWESYFTSAYESLGQRQASYFCFAMVYTVLKHIKNPRRIIPFCLNLLYRKMETEAIFFPYIVTLFNQPKNSKVYTIKLDPQPEKPDVFRKQLLTYDTPWWAEVTSGFDQSYIREIVNLWKDKEEQLAIVDIIERHFMCWDNVHKEWHETPDNIITITKELNDAKARERELLNKIEEQKKKRLPLSELLDYAESFPACQNERAKIVKEIILDLYDPQHLSSEEKSRIRNLGMKENFINIERVNDIHDNAVVKAGISN